MTTTLRRHWALEVLLEGTCCSAIHHAGREVWLYVCVVSGVIAESLLFPPVRINNSKQYQPRWSSCICSWISSILKNKWLNCKCWSAGDREDVCRGGLYDRPRLGEGEFTTLVVNLQPGWTNALSIISNVNELLRRIQPLRPEKATARNYFLTGPITALTARVYATCS